MALWRLRSWFSMQNLENPPNFARRPLAVLLATIFGLMVPSCTWAEDLTKGPRTADQTSAAQDQPTLASDVDVQHTDEPALTLDAIDFYSSGLAKFRYRSEVEGEAKFTVFVPRTSVSDVLRTIRVDDPENRLRSILAISEPRTQSQKDSAVPATTSRIDCLMSLRGEQILFELSQGRILEGQLMALENSRETQGANIIEQVRISLLTQNGIESFLLHELARFRCVKPAVQSSVEQTVARLASRSADRQCPIEVVFAEGPRRNVSLSFMQPSPVWKCSYSLTDGQLQMHVVIDNATTQDWENVAINVIDGRPIAFEVDLHSSVSLERPVMSLPLGVPGLPPVFEEAVPQASRDESPAAATPDRGPGFRGGMGGMGGAFGGMGGSMGGGGYSPNLSLVVSDPSDESMSARLGLPFPVSASAGVSVGSPLELSFPPTTIPARSTALLGSPALKCDIEEMSVYSKEYDNSIPLRSFKLKNDSQFLLPAGPLTFSAQGRYRGEAMLPRFSAGASQLVSYALDSALKIKELQHQHEDELESVAFDEEHKQLIVKRKATWTRTFFIRNSSENARSVLMLLEKGNDWQTQGEHADKVVDTSDLLHVTFNVDANLQKTHQVILTRTSEANMEYSTSSAESLRAILNEGGMTAESRKRLLAILEHKTSMLELKRQIELTQQSVRACEKEVDRLARVLSTRGLQAAVIEKYGKRIEAKESELEDLRSQMKTRQSALSDHEAALIPRGRILNENSSKAKRNSSSDPFGGSDGNPFSN